MKRFVIGLVVFVAVAALGAYGLFHWLLQPETLRGYVKQGIEGVWTGKVDVGSASVTLVPPAVSIDGVALKTADGATKLLSLEAFQLVPSLGALLERKVQIQAVNLVGPRVNLAKDGTGELLVAKGFHQSKDSDEDKEKRQGEEGSGGAFLSGIRIDRVNVRDFRLLVPEGADGTPLDVGPVDGSFAVTVAPALALDGSLTVAPLVVAPLRLAAMTAAVAMKDGAVTVQVDLPTIDVATPGLDPIRLGPVKATVKAGGAAPVTVAPLTIAVPPKGTVTITVKAVDGAVTADVTASTIELAELLAKPLAALRPTKAAAPALTVKSLTGTVRRSAAGAVELAGWKGTFGNGAQLAMGGSPQKLTVKLSDYKLYDLLEGVVAEYELGPPIKTVTLPQLQSVVTPTKLSVPVAVVTAGTVTKATAVAALDLAAAGTPFTADSAVDVVVAGPDLFELLKQAPAASLTGNLGGKLSINGTPAAPLVDGKLTSPSLTYRYSTAPPVPLEDVTATVGLKDMVVNVSSLTAKLFGGHVEGSGKADLNATPLTFEWKLDSVEIHLDRVVATVPMLQNHLTGTLKATTKGRGVGTAIAGLSADGTIEAQGVTLRDAAKLLVPSLSGEKALVDVVASSLTSMLSTTSTKDLQVQSLTSALRMADGAVQLNDVVTKGPVGMSAEGLQFKVDDGSLGGKVSFAVPVQGNPPVTIPVTLGGTLLAPFLKVDASVLKKQLTDEALKALTGKLTGKALDTTAVKTEVKDKVADVKQGAQDKLQDTLDKKLGDGAGNLLRGLFK